MESKWLQKITTLKGVGPKIADKLAKLGIQSVGDLLLHCPYRYEDRTHLTPITDLRAEQWVLIQGEIVDLKVTKFGKKRATLLLADKSGIVPLVFFHYVDQQLKHWQPGMVLRCYGQAKVSLKGLNMIHPDYDIISSEEANPLPSSLTPVYPTVAGLSQGWLRKTILAEVDNYIHSGKQHPDPFAERLTHLQPMLPWFHALNVIHQPSPAGESEKLLAREHPAFYRLILEELYAHYISLKKLRTTAKKYQANTFELDNAQEAQFLAKLPFDLTAAQARVWQEIRHDLASDLPMLRLVQGDVGCGKTVIAALAAFAVLSQHGQVALMVPTEILAEQHFNYFTALFCEMGYRCDVLTGQLKAKEKRSLIENLKLGLTHIVIGTHALFQDNIEFKSLGLVIIDEQHRFGVHQRLTLQNKGLSATSGISAHQLIMTATPIPRTLAMSHYAHLDMSIIDSLPPNRQPITTIVLPQTRREEIIARIAHVCEKGQQVYWICTLIDESDTLECQAAQVTAQMLQTALAPLLIGLVHGKMSSAEKESIMQDFYLGKIHVLVATTVIEVGVNVPNATLMVVENPERLGLAQLHQLRGRVGRGAQASYCVLLYQPPLSEMAQARLSIMRESCDGFVIAQADLDLRGPGEVLGTRQTGLKQFKIADYKRDAVLIQQLSSWVEKLNDLSSEQIEHIIRRWCHHEDYAQV